MSLGPKHFVVKTQELKLQILFRHLGQSIQKSRLSKFCGRQPLKNLLSPLLNTLSHLML